MLCAIQGFSVGLSPFVSMFVREGPSEKARRMSNRCMEVMCRRTAGVDTPLALVSTFRRVWLPFFSVISCWWNEMYLGQ